jgi:hypothetical protein
VKPPVSHEHVSVAPEEPQTRRELLRMGGIAAIASVLGVLGISGVTEGKNGSSLRIGSKNSAPVRRRWIRGRALGSSRA